MPRVGSNLMEVARRCSVSQSTVSRVLNNSKHGRFSVSPAVRDRILKVAQELNYRPSIAARNLAVSKTRLVAVLGVMGILSDRVGPQEGAIGALAKSLDHAGYEICVQFGSFRHGPFELPPLRVDGVVAVGPENLEELESLESGDTPYVSLDGVAGKHGLQVIPDDASGTRLALRHLVDLGHRRIAYLDHPSIAAHHISVSTRRLAFAQASKEMGFEIADVQVPQLSDHLPWDSYYEPFLSRATVDEKATAVLAYSHYGALSLLRMAFDMGLNVPRDFSLVCFNNEPIVSLSIPSLTAVDVPSAAMGNAAAQLLLRAMDDSTQEKDARIKCQKLEERLIVRESTAPPRRL